MNPFSPNYPYCIDKQKPLAAILSDDLSPIGANRHSNVSQMAGLWHFWKGNCLEESLNLATAWSDLDMQLMYMPDEVLPTQNLHQSFRKRLVKIEPRQYCRRLRAPRMPARDIDAMLRHQAAYLTDHTGLVITAHDQQLAPRLEVNAIVVDLQYVGLLPVEQRAGDANLFAIVQCDLTVDDIAILTDLDALRLR